MAGLTSIEIILVLFKVASDLSEEVFDTLRIFLEFFFAHIQVLSGERRRYLAIFKSLIPMP